MRFHSTSVEPHADVPLVDDDVLDVLETETETETPLSDSAYVLSVGTGRDPVQRDAQLSEILGLVEAHGMPIAGFEQLVLRRPDPRTWLGSGTAREVADRARAAGAGMIVIDAQLSPSQMRNLEDATALPISDRELVILGVFLKHARTRAARIQIEIAHLAYLRPRIRGLGLDMDQQAGGVMNGKGAGETASELLARQLDDRMVKLKQEAARLENADALRREKRACPRIALVGYTNAGKTSLMNALTGAELSTRSRPFETLDTTTRSLSRHGGDVLIGDTVGFIRDLPERLLPSFATTLAEAREATLIALVLDASDPEWPLHLETTEAQLDALDATSHRLVVFNKCDRLEQLPTLDRPHAHVSALEPERVQALCEELLERARRSSQRTATLVLPYAESRAISTVYGRCRVLESEARDDELVLTVEGPNTVLDELERWEVACNSQPAD